MSKKIGEKAYWALVKSRRVKSPLEIKRKKDFEIQEKLLKKADSEILAPPGMAVSGIEGQMHRRMRGEVFQYHYERGTLNTAIHSPKAAKAQYEVPYFFEARRLERELYAKGVTDDTPIIRRTIWLAIKITLKTAWIRLKGWMRTYMPLSYENFNLARI